MAWTRDAMATSAARELQDGFYVNLGIGIPTLVANVLPPGVTVTLQGENGMLGIGPFPSEDEVDSDLINAGRRDEGPSRGEQCRTRRPGGRGGACGRRTVATLSLARALLDLRPA